MLFSATPVDPAMMPGSEDAAMVLQVDPVDEGSSSQDMETSAEASSIQSANEIIIVDSSVPDLQELLDDLSGSGRQAEVFVLDSERDGVDQITEILEGRSEVDSLHVVSHAENGRVKLGNVWLGESNLGGYAGQVASWQGSFQMGADILFYGCELAADADGRAFLQSVSALTGADVAASDDDTGHSRFNADWELEFATGSVESDVAFGP